MPLEPRSTRPRLVELRFEALGSRCHLLAVGLSAAALERARAWVEGRHRQLTRFDDSSELSLLNRSGGSWVSVSASLEDLLRAALYAYERSGGLVHAGVLGCVVGAGYGQTLIAGPTTVRLELAVPPPPLPEMLEVRRRAARLAAGAGLDVGGLAKGWLADRLAARLGENVLVNLGGDLRARGAGPTGAGWPVGIGGSTVLLRDRGAATSSVLRRAWGPGLHHLIDPRTGRPVLSDVREASVLAESAFEAEILAKMAVLAGAAEAEKLLSGAADGWSLVAA